MNNLDKLNQAFDQYKEHFEGLFHGTLWAILVNNFTQGKVACFVSNYTKCGLQLGVAYANEKGYTPTPSYFKDGITYDTAQDIIDNLNAIVFNLDEPAAAHIQLYSMRPL